MRAVFDFIKDTLRKIDGYWIESAGHPIVVKGVFKRDEAVEKLYREDRGTVFDTLPHVTFHGFYDYPTLPSLTCFGIDAPDEMEVQVNYDIVTSRLGKVPEIGTLLTIEQSDWMVINRSYIYNRFIGKYRLALLCARYQESVTTGNGTCKHKGVK